MRRKGFIVTLLLGVFLLTGCGAMSTAIKKRNLEVSTQMSKTIWLDPSNQKTVYLQIRNTSDKDMSGLQSLIAYNIKAKGYTITTSPDDAYYWIQVNVLKADKMDLREAESFLDQGYQGAVLGAAIGGGVTAFNTNSAGTALGIGLASGLIGIAADSMIEDINYSMITDIQISEKTKVNVTTTNIAALEQGTSSTKIQTSQQEGERHKYQTRIVSNANKVNLKFEEAKPELEQQLAKSISDILYLVVSP